MVYHQQVTFRYLHISLCKQFKTSTALHGHCLSQLHPHFLSSHADSLWWPVQKQSVILVSHSTSFKSAPRQQWSMTKHQPSVIKAWSSNLDKIEPSIHHAQLSQHHITALNWQKFATQKEPLCPDLLSVGIWRERRVISTCFVLRLEVYFICNLTTLYLNQWNERWRSDWQSGCKATNKHLN